MFPSILALIGAAERRAAVLRRDAETDAIDAGRHLAEADAALWQEAADEARIELAALLPESRARGVSTPSMTLIAVIVLVVLGLITVWFKVHGYWNEKFSPEERAALTSGGNASTKDVHFGYAVGGGAEWAFTRNWSIKAEYVYLGFPRGGTTLVIPGGVANAARFDLHTVKGGINYRFWALSEIIRVHTGNLLVRSSSAANLKFLSVCSESV